MSDIPAARQQLADILQHPDVPVVIRSRLELVLPLLTRERTKPITARKEGAKVDARLAEEIRQAAKRHPQASTMTLARLFGVNPGRVSEAIAGKR